MVWEGPPGYLWEFIQDFALLQSQQPEGFYAAHCLSFVVCLSLITLCEQQNVVSVGAGSPGGPGVSKVSNVQTMQDSTS